MLTAAMTARRYLLVISGWLACSLTWAGTIIRVENPLGNTTVRSVMGGSSGQVRASVQSRALRPDDVKYTKEPGMFLVQCQPADGARVDLDVTLPHTATLEATTKSGRIEINGLIRNVDLDAGDGEVKLAVPWELMRVRVVSKSKPLQVTTPALALYGFPSQNFSGFWTLYDRRNDHREGVPYEYHLGLVPLRWASGRTAVTGLVVLRRLEAYGDISVAAGRPSRLELVDVPLPADSWIKPARLAEPLLDALLVRRPKDGGQSAAPQAQKSEARRSAASSAAPFFTSNVRLVSLSFAVYDRQGHPVPGLKAEDFEVLEEGVPEKVAIAASEELPFNLVLLLDSNLTYTTHQQVADIARGFVGVARPEDRVAVYLSVVEALWMLSPLATDRTRLQEAVESLASVPPGFLPGTKPLAAVIALAYAQESLPLAPGRSALVVITDGIAWRVPPPADDRYKPPPPDLAFAKLRGATAELPVLVYPILLPRTTGGDVVGTGLMTDLRAGMQQLADASGGRLFKAESIRDMASVYAQVAEELRSVYTIGYYPQNQNFDGKYRRIQVKVKRPGLSLRTRPGYYAW
jgi:Ca-activated chloride channel family protein